MIDLLDNSDCNLFQQDSHLQQNTFKESDIWQLSFTKSTRVSATKSATKSTKCNQLKSGTTKSTPRKSTST